MDSFSLYGVTCEIILDIRRKKANNLYPVKYRITYQRKQVYLNSGIDLSVKEWEIIPDTRKTNLKETRELICIRFDELKNQLKEIFKKGEVFSFDNLKKKIVKGDKESVFQDFENKIKKLKNEGRIGSAIAYSCAYNSLKTFVNNSDLKYINVNVAFLNDYEKWMLKHENSYTTIGIYNRQLRAIYNEAIKDLKISEYSYPFGESKYRIPRSTSIKKALTLDKIKEIFFYSLKEGSIAEMCRDLWIFSYLCNGINVNDICKLKYSNIKDGEISFYRQKTIHTTRDKRLIVVPLTKELSRVIDKWGNYEKKQVNFIFPFLKNNISPIEEKKQINNLTSLINKNMKRIGEKIGISNISTYTARHSFATVLKRAGANISFISESLGHTDLKTTENYLASFEKEERNKNAELLIKFI